MAFAGALDDNIAAMREEIRAGRYRFSRLRIAPVPKDSGGYRIIAIPTVRDRLTQRVLLAHLVMERRFRACSPISYGFVRGKTLADAQRQACAHRQTLPWVLKADIVKFFDRIPRHLVKALIRRQVGRKIVAELLCAAVDSELEYGNRKNRGAELAIESGIKEGLGLRQGMPISPVLSNMLLKRFDDALEARRITAVRYADDIAVFGTDRIHCLEALAFIQGELAHLELQIPSLADETKTRVFGPSESVEFLGIDIKRFQDGYRLCAPARKLEEIEADMAKIASAERCVEEKQNIGQVVRALDAFVVGHLAALAVIDSSEGFFRRLEAARQRQLDRLLSELIGREVVKQLSADARAILGLQRFAA